MSTDPLNSLQVARLKLAAVIEIYAPAHVNVHEAAIAAITAAVEEFEAAVREDAAGTDAVALQAQVNTLTNELAATRARLVTHAAAANVAPAPEAPEVVAADAVPPADTSTAAEVAPSAADAADGNDEQTPEGSKSKRAKK